jgi:hypothetical protein
MVIKRVECSSGEGTVDIFGGEGEEWEWRESFFFTGKGVEREHFFFTGKGVERELFTERNGGSSRHGAASTSLVFASHMGCPAPPTQAPRQLNFA